MSYEYDFQGDHETVFVNHKDPEGRTLVARPNEVVVTDYEIEHPLLQPRQKKSKASDPAPAQTTAEASSDADKEE